MMPFLSNIILSKSRRVWTCPPHFIKVNIFDDTPGDTLLMPLDGKSDKLTIVRNWQYEHIKNRFYIGQAITFNNGLLVVSDVAAFENPADATYFTLVRPNLISE